MYWIADPSLDCGKGSTVNFMGKWKIWQLELRQRVVSAVAFMRWGVCCLEKKRPNLRVLGWEKRTPDPCEAGGWIHSSSSSTLVLWGISHPSNTSCQDTHLQLDQWMSDTHHRISIYMLQVPLVCNFVCRNLSQCIYLHQLHRFQIFFEPQQYRWPWRSHHRRNWTLLHRPPTNP